MRAQAGTKLGPPAAAALDAFIPGRALAAAQAAGAEVLIASRIQASGRAGREESDARRKLSGEAGGDRPDTRNH